MGGGTDGAAVDADQAAFGAWMADCLNRLRFGRKSLRFASRAGARIVFALCYVATMHEMSLAEGVLDLVVAAARREAAMRVRLVVLEIGQLSAVEPEALRFCFDAVTRDTLAADAVLEIEEVPGSGWCAHCAATVPMAERYSECPQCGGYPLQPTAGTEMRVREIGIE